MKRLNLIVLGNFEYPHGMAGSKRIQHAIDSLSTYEDVSISVIILRQSSKHNPLEGIHKGVPYKTVMSDLLRTKFVLKYLLFYVRSQRAIKKAYKQGMKNILYVYGPPSIDNIPAIRQAKKMGFKVVFDIVEDDELASDISNSLWHKLKNWLIRLLTKKIDMLSDGIVVISSHLKKKFKKIVSKDTPLLLRPISVDMKLFTDNRFLTKQDIRLLYSGSFGTKDGVEYLIKAFEIIASKYPNIYLVLTGKGSKERMRIIRRQIRKSAFSDRIEYMGYLKDEGYYEVLNNCDIPCMTRTNIAYAHTGFPFKLGEYLASGKPVIASNVSDVRKYLKHKYSAMLVHPSSVDGIVEAVEYLLKNSKKAGIIGYRGRKVAQHYFDYRIHGQALRDFFDRI